MTDDFAPHSVEAEGAVLGAVLINPEALYDLPFLRPEHFFIERYGWVWKAILRLQERGDPIDVLTVSNELQATGHLDEFGGMAAISEIARTTPTALNADGYGHIVERLAVRRRLLRASEKIARLAHSDETELDDVLGGAEAALFEITRERQNGTAAGVRELVSEHYDRTVEMMRNPNATPGYPTGWADLDRLLGGLLPGTVTVIAARPGMGKTVMAENIVRHNAKLGNAGGFVSLEMNGEEMTSRMIAAESGLDLNRVRQARLAQRDIDRYQDAVTRLAQLPLVFDFPARVTPQILHSTAQRWVFDHDIRLLVIDYVQLMSAPGFKGSERVQEVSYITRHLKLLAKEFKLAVIEVAQLNRECESRHDKRPLLSDLKESGSLEQDADVVIFPYRDAYYNDEADEGRAEFNVAKHRNGPTGMVEVGWQGTAVRFVNAMREL